MLTTVGLIIVCVLSNVIVATVAYKTGRLDEKLEREWDVKENGQDSRPREV